MLDWDRVTELQNEVGEDAFAEVVEIFLEEVEELIETYRTGQPPQDVGGEMHFLRGSAMNLGFSTFAEICNAAEQAAKHSTPVPLDLKALCDCYDASKAELMNWMQKASVA